MKIIYWLKIILKTLSLRRFRIYYSQFGEDVILRELIGKQKKGFYVDVGCWHPIRFSNTYWLYRRGWNGINIDMEHMKIAMFNIARRKDINVIAAVSNKKKDLYMHKTYNFDLGARLVNKPTNSTIKITTQTLNDIISKTKYKHQEIDLLSIDAEGHDFYVLQSLNWNVYNPKIVIVESWDTNIYKILKSKLNIFLEDKGYQLISWTSKSLIYKKQN